MSSLPQPLGQPWLNETLNYNLTSAVTFRMIKFNSTLAFILIFVLVTIGSGLVSGLKGYTLGYEALKEVSQPEVKPSQNQLRGENNESSGKQAVIVSEADILQEVNGVMNRNSDQATPLDGQKASSQSSNDEDSFIESP